MGEIDWSKLTEDMAQAGIKPGQLWEDKREQPRRNGPSFKRQLRVEAAGWNHTTNVPLVVCKVVNRTKWGYPDAMIRLDRFKQTCNLVREAPSQA